MPIGAVLLFDAETEATILEAWTALADAGVSRSMLAPGIRPHLTLSVGADFDVERANEDLASVARDLAPFRIGLPSLGVFADTGVIYLGVTPSATLLQVHRRVDAVCEGAARSLHDWYRPDGWVPHVSLAGGLDADGLAAAVRLLAEPPLKLSARAEVLALIEGDETGWTEHGAHPFAGS
jgi:hypothetical protein